MAEFEKFLDPVMPRIVPVDQQTAGWSIGQIEELSPEKYTLVLKLGSSVVGTVTGKAKLMSGRTIAISPSVDLDRECAGLLIQCQTAEDLQTLIDFFSYDNYR